MLEHILFFVAFHEGKIEGPPGQAHDRDPDELLFEKKFKKWNLSAENLLKGQDVHPALVVAENKIPTLRGKILTASHLPPGLVKKKKDPIVDADPAEADEDENAGAENAAGTPGDQEFHKSDDEERNNMDEG
jgi:hypothetical protein